MDQRKKPGDQSDTVTTQKSGGDDEVRSVLLSQFLQQETKPDSSGGSTGDKTTAPAQPSDLHALTDQLAATRLNGKDLDRFRKDMQAFETRANAAGLGQAEIDKTYTAIDRLLSDGTDQTIRHDLKSHLAEQVMHHAAHPTSIDQGSHKTCGVTTVEARTYTRSPSSAAKLVADIATTGKFVTADGTTIELDKESLQPDWEAGSSYPQDNQRSYASQLFQVTAVNAHWSRSHIDNKGNLVHAGDIHYEQHSFSPLSLKNNDDSGERLLNTAKQPPEELAKQPYLAAGDIVDITNQITGLQEKPFVVENKEYGGGDTLQVASEAEFKSTLEELKKENRLPAIVRVSALRSPFDISAAQTPQSSKTGTWHLVCITDYDPVKGQLSIDNQWGPGNDIKRVDAAKIYKATLPPDHLQDLHGVPIIDGQKKIDKPIF